jgi:osmotically-inducible protein OsmY
LDSKNSEICGVAAVQLQQQNYSIMKTNLKLQKDVQNAIKCEPLLHAAEIGVTVKDGVVSLTSVMDSYGKKRQQVILLGIPLMFGI